MRKRSEFALLTAGTALSLSLAAAPAAFAVTAPAPVPASHGGGGSGGGGGSNRPGGQAVKNQGNGSLGTHWTLKSMHDDNDATGAQIVGEEFEIDAPDPQNWTITLTDGTVTFPFTETIGADSLTVNGMTPNQPGTQHMTASATDTVTHETISALKAQPGCATMGTTGCGDSWLTGAGSATRSATGAGGGGSSERPWPVAR